MRQESDAACPECELLIGLRRQLEDNRVPINFGDGGAGYAYTCTRCSEAAFLC